MSRLRKQLERQARLDCEFGCDPSGPKFDQHAPRCPIALEAELAEAREGFEKMRLLCRRDLHPNPADVELLVDNLARKMLGPFGHTEQVCQRAPHYGSCKALPALAAGGEKPGGKP